MGTLIKHGQGCPSCSSSDGFAVYENGGFCFSCHYVTRDTDNEGVDSNPSNIKYKPKTDFVAFEHFPLNVKNWLTSRMITHWDCLRYNITYSPTMRRLCVPQYDHNKRLSGYQLRALSPFDLPKVLSIGSGIFFATEWDLVKQLIIVEDFISCIRVGRFAATLSLNGSKLRAELFELLTRYPTIEKIIVWLDWDHAGINGRLLVQQSLSQFKPCGHIITDKDPKNYTDTEIQQFLNIALN